MVLTTALFYFAAMVFWAIKLSIVHSLVFSCAGGALIAALPSHQNRLFMSLALLLLALFVALGVFPQAMTLMDSDDAVYHRVSEAIANTVPLKVQLQAWKLDYVIAAGLDEGFVIANPGYYKLLAIIYTIIPITPENKLWLGLYTSIFSYMLFVFSILKLKLPHSEINGHSMAGAALYFTIIASPALLQAALLVRKDCTVLFLMTITLMSIIKEKTIKAAIFGCLLCTMRIAYLPLVALLFVIHFTHTTKSNIHISIKRLIIALLWCLIIVALLFTFFPTLVNTWLPFIDIESLIIIESKIGRTGLLLDNPIGRIVYVHVNQFPDHSLKLGGQIWMWVYLFIQILGIISLAYTMICALRNPNKVTMLALAAYTILFLASMLVCVQAVSTGLHFLNEPRYHIALFVVGFILWCGSTKLSPRDTSDS